VSRSGLYACVKIAAVLLIATGFSVAAHCQCVTASQVTLTGTLRTSNGLPSSNDTISLTPSQQGFISGCGINLPVANFCATSTDGTVVQSPNPVSSTVNTTSGSGSLPSGTYYTIYEWYDSLGHVTLPSPETRTVLSVTGSLVVNPPASGIPSTAAGMDVFISTTSGTETLQGQTTGSASFVQSTALTTGASPATSNNTVCVATANDAVWPTGTGYIVTMTDSSGNGIPGYPMQWQLIGAGTTINLSNGLPYYHGVVTYPVPILSAPQNHGNQSISGGLSLGGYNLLNAGKVGVGTAVPGWPLDVENGLGNFQSGFLIGGVAPTTQYCAGSSDGVSIDAYLACVLTLPTLYNQTIQVGGSSKPQEPKLNLIAGTNTTITATDSSGVSTNVTINNTAVTGPNPNTPTWATASACSGGSIALAANSNDGAGSLTVASGCNAGQVGALTFGGTYAKPLWCTFSTGNPGQSGLLYLVSAGSTTGFSLVTANTLSAPFINYLCHQ
jgi:hypothetical protein